MKIVESVRQITIFVDKAIFVQMWRTKFNLHMNVEVDVLISELKAPQKAPWFLFSKDGHTGYCHGR